MEAGKIREPHMGSSLIDVLVTFLIHRGREAGKLGIDNSIDEVVTPVLGHF